MGKKALHSGNSAVAHVAHATSEVIAIYPITPSSDMGEIADEKSAMGEKNIWGSVPTVKEMQSEAGASAACHGALLAGSIATTFTASQGLLLMIPEMFKIAGELCPTVFHIAARSVATHALSIFGDHSDVMSVRSTGWAMLSSGSVQEAMDLALIAVAASLESRIPFVHFFDGFRTSHEIQKIDELSFDEMRAMIDDTYVIAHRNRGLNPERPTIKGTSQNPDVYFQSREAVNKYYNACPSIVSKVMDKFGTLTGRRYHLFDYFGSEDAESVIVIMGSAGETVEETVRYLNKKGEKVGVVKVRLYRPFDAKAFVEVLPPTVRSIAVLDRTKEPGAIGEPLYEDVRTAVGEAMERGFGKLKEYPKIVGGRYGLGSKEFSPPMVKAVFDNLKEPLPKNHFTVGIDDDVTHSSLNIDESFDIEGDVYEAVFYGLGSDGTVGANKNSIKIIGEHSDNYAQGYFVYDSKKAGALTISHLRFGHEKICKPYLIKKARFLACHNFAFLERYNILKHAIDGGIFLLNAPYSKDEVWNHLPAHIQREIIRKKLKFYVIDAVKISEELGLGARINTIMQAAFFKIAGVIDESTAIEAIKEAIKKTYGKKGEKVVSQNISAVDLAISNVERVDYPDKVTGRELPSFIPDSAPEFVKNVTLKIMLGEGDELPVSSLPEDGTWPTATSQYEKRDIAINIPVWDPNTCVQCGRCTLVCPHAAIRANIYPKDLIKDAPKTFKYTTPKPSKGLEEYLFTIQVAPLDCTGCGLCAENCPAKEKGALKMAPALTLKEEEEKNWEFFLSLPEPKGDVGGFRRDTMKGLQYVRPLFEFSGACAGCGETPYIKLLTQLFGDRLIITNATGCSSIYGGNLPTTPYCTRKDGRGPTWVNSLFEDNAEAAFGARLSVDNQLKYVNQLARQVIDRESCDAKVKELLKEILNSKQTNQEEIEAQRRRVETLKMLLKECKGPNGRLLDAVADAFIKKSVWAVGGDGWAYDIGYGGLDHVLAQCENVNILVLDTEVYSNTGGQSSKSTPIGAVAKFAAAGKSTKKKDLALMAMSYGYVYVAKVALGADPQQAIRAFLEAEAYDGPSIIIAYSHCIAHGIDMSKGMEEQKKAVASGHWILFRYNPLLKEKGENPLQLDSKEPTLPIEEYLSGENRFRILMKTAPERAKELASEAKAYAAEQWRFYKYLSEGSWWKNEGKTA